MSPPRVASVLLAIAIAAAPNVATAQASEFESTLLGLADRALAEGDLRTSEKRYRRVLAANRHAAAAHAGLGNVARQRGDAKEAAAHFDAALGEDPQLTAAHLGLAALASESGDAAAARTRLDAAIEIAPLDPVLHQHRFELTGLAPEGRGLDEQAIHSLAAAHPYDPRIQLAMARFALSHGDEKSARQFLESALLMADLAPGTAPAAAQLLGSLTADERSFVPIHVYADESVREQPGWEFELRIAWARAASVLRPLLATHFVPIAIHPFSSAQVPDDLGSIHLAMLAAVQRVPLDGIIAGFTRRDSPRTPLAHRLGQAQYFGRDMVVRIHPQDLQGRTLAHEVLHLYGAIHLSDEITSLMNPVSSEWILDPFNARIIASTRTRRFGPGPFERNVLDRVDEAALAKALLAAIAVNVQFRNAGIQQALEQARSSRVVGARQARQAMGQDQHLAQVARLTAYVLLRVERAVEGVLLMESAARLFGPTTAEGRAAHAEADRWRAHYKAFLAN